MGLVSPILSAGEEALLALLPDTDAGDAARIAMSEKGLPTRRVEAFKWSDLRAALGEGVAAADGSARMIPTCLQDALVIDFATDGVGIEGDKGDGLTISAEASDPVDPSAPLASLAAGFAPRTLLLTVEKPQERPIVLRRHPGSPMRVRLEVLSGASICVVDTALAVAGLSTGLIEISVAPGATVTRLSLQQGGVEAIDLLHTAVSIAPGGTYEATALSFGGKFARAETMVEVLGPEASCRLDGAYLLAGKAHSDATTRIVHKGPGGQTRELYKGAVKDKARGVFQGKILVERAAQETDARQNHHAIMLSEGCEIDAKPELEIYADNVQCAHGNTVGALDEQALFYMRQRGIPAAQARALLVQAFVGEVLDGIAHEGVRGWFDGLCTTWMVEALR